MGPFLRGFCSELTKTADQPGYGYSAGGSKPGAGPAYGTVQQADVGQTSKPYSPRPKVDQWRPSPKPPAPVDNRAPVDPYAAKPKVKAAPAKPKHDRMGFPDLRMRSSTPTRKFTEDDPAAQKAQLQKKMETIVPLLFDKEKARAAGVAAKGPLGGPREQGQFAQMPTAPDKGE